MSLVSVFASLDGITNVRELNQEKVSAALVASKNPAAGWIGVRLVLK